MKDDPRRPDKIISFKNCVQSTGEAPPDWFGFIAVLFAMIGFMMRVKWATWASLIMFLSGYSTSRSSSQDYSQLITSFSMIIISLMTNYAMVFRS